MIQATVDDAVLPIFNDELIPTEFLVRFKTQASISSGSKLRPIFIIHGISGFATAMKKLAAKLTAPVYGLQCTADVSYSSLADLAEYWVERIRSIQKTGPYIIAGYSYGASMAFEIGTLLEEAGEMVTVVMFDGSPKYSLRYIELYRQKSDNISPERTFAMMFCQMIFINWDYSKVRTELDGIASLGLDYKHVAELVASKTKFAVDTVQSAALLFSTKLKHIIDYQPKRKLTAGKVILFKTTEDHGNLPADYGLSEVKLYESMRKNRKTKCRVILRPVEINW